MRISAANRVKLRRTAEAVGTSDTELVEMLVEKYLGEAAEQLLRERAEKTRKLLAELNTDPKSD